MMSAGKLTTAELGDGIKKLDAAGLPLARDALIVVSSDESAIVITTLLNIPETKRPPLEAALYDRHNPANNPLNYIKLTQTALRLYRQTLPADRTAQDGLLRFLLLFGFGSSQFDLSSVGRQYKDGNPQGALYMLQYLLTRFSHDTTLQTEAYQMLKSRIGCSLQDRALMARWMCASLQPQCARRIRRLFYLDLAQNSKLDETLSLTALRRDPDKLSAAESHLALGAHPEASALFTQVLTSPDEPLPRRLAAWSGLWDADPDKAVATTEALTTELLALPDSPERTALIRWFGGEMGRVAPIISQGRVSPRPSATQPAGYAAMADSMARLLATDPVACLRQENANGPSLRYAAGLIFTLAKRGTEANEAVARVVEYTECPKPGTMYASSMAKLQTPMDVLTPRLGETEEVVTKLVQTLTTYDKSFGKANTTPITPEPPNRKAIIDACARLATATHPHEVKEDVRRLGKQYALAIAYLDPVPQGVMRNAPPPPPREVNIEDLQPIHEAIASTFRNTLVCMNADIFIQEGLQKSMLTASSPALLDAIFSLATRVLDQAVANNPSGALKPIITNYANYLEGRQVWNLKPYADQLRQRYLVKQ